jgi:hypothetical protein
LRSQLGAIRRVGESQIHRLVGFIDGVVEDQDGKRFAELPGRECQNA